MCQYSLITKQGRIWKFYIKEIAELFQLLNGGIILVGPPEKSTG